MKEFENLTKEDLAWDYVQTTLSGGATGKWGMLVHWAEKDITRLKALIRAQVPVDELTNRNSYNAAAPQVMTALLNYGGEKFVKNLYDNHQKNEESREYSNKSWAFNKPSFLASSVHKTLIQYAPQILNKVKFDTAVEPTVTNETGKDVFEFESSLSYPYNFLPLLKLLDKVPKTSEQKSETFAAYVRSFNKALSSPSAIYRKDLQTAHPLLKKIFANLTKDEQENTQKLCPTPLSDFFALNVDEIIEISKEAERLKYAHFSSPVSPRPAPTPVVRPVLSLKQAKQVISQKKLSDEEIDDLIASGIDLNTPAYRGVSLLVHMIKMGSYKVVPKLLKAGADIKGVVGLRACCAAISKGSTPTLKVLIDAGVDPWDQSATKGLKGHDIPFFNAISYGQERCLKMLLEQPNANPHIIEHDNKNGYFYLLGYWMSWGNQLKSLKCLNVLLSHSVNPKHQDNEGNTFLTAVRKGGLNKNIIESFEQTLERYDSYLLAKRLNQAIDDELLSEFAPTVKKRKM